MNTEVKENNKDLILFENKKIRRQEYNGEWFYSIVDVIEILTESERPEKYWSDLKKKIETEGVFELSEKIGRLKMIAKDGKNRLTDCSNRETIFRIIQSVPSPNAEPFKQWFARLAEVTTTELHRTNDSQGIRELKVDAHDGGEVAAITRRNIEKRIGKPIVTSENAINLNFITN
jgi:hypothetical protein